MRVIQRFSKFNLMMDLHRCHVCRKIDEGKDDYLKMCNQYTQDSEEKKNEKIDVVHLKITLKNVDQMKFQSMKA